MDDSQAATSKQCEQISSMINRRSGPPWVASDYPSNVIPRTVARVQLDRHISFYGLRGTEGPLDDVRVHRG
jgi:hypothetical protein